MKAVSIFTRLSKENPLLIVDGDVVAILADFPGGCKYDAHADSLSECNQS